MIWFDILYNSKLNKIREWYNLFQYWVSFILILLLFHRPNPWKRWRNLLFLIVKFSSSPGSQLGCSSQNLHSTFQKLILFAIHEVVFKGCHLLAFKQFLHSVCSLKLRIPFSFLLTWQKFHPFIFCALHDRGVKSLIHFRKLYQVQIHFH